VRLRYAVCGLRARVQLKTFSSLLNLGLICTCGIFQKLKLHEPLLALANQNIASLKKLQKLKHVDSYIDLVDCLANMGD